jgi:hypothetical protein
MQEVSQIDFFSHLQEPSRTLSKPWNVTDVSCYAEIGVRKSFSNMPPCQFKTKSVAASLP